MPAVVSATLPIAIYMAKHGNYEIEAIDIVQCRIIRARKNIKTARMEDSITARHGDYHHLEKLQNGSFDGVDTMENLVHSTKSSAVLRECMRILKPSGRITLHEDDHDGIDKAPNELVEAMRTVNALASMPANVPFDKDVLKDLLQGAGFQGVQLRDVVPMLWFFYLLAVIPYIIFKFLGIERYFVRTIAGAYSYKSRTI